MQDTADRLANPVEPGNQKSKRQQNLGKALALTARNAVTALLFAVAVCMLLVPDAPSTIEFGWVATR